MTKAMLQQRVQELEATVVRLNNLLYEAKQTMSEDERLKELQEAKAEAIEARAKADEAEEDKKIAEAALDALQGALMGIADDLADRGLIHSTPHAKREWIERLSN